MDNLDPYRENRDRIAALPRLSHACQYTNCNHCSGCPHKCHDKKPEGSPDACTALALVRRCLECRRPTVGSLGQAGYYWPRLCQPCKDFADGYLRAQVRTQAILVQAITAIVNQDLQPGSLLSHSPKGESYV